MVLQNSHGVGQDDLDIYVLLEPQPVYYGWFEL